MTVERIDMGAQALVQRMRQLGRTRVTAGIQDREAARRRSENRDVTVGEVARFIQFGTDIQPARPFMDAAVSRLSRVLPRPAADAAAAVVEGAQPARALERVGRAAAATIRREARRVIQNPTGQTEDAVTYVIREGEVVRGRGSG